MKIEELEWIIRDFDGSNMDECRYLASYLMPFIDHHIPKWRPIEEAPRTGAEVLVYVPSGKTIITAWYCEETGLWPHGEAFSDEGEPLNVGLPSHFMPLPSPPKEDE